MYPTFLERYDTVFVIWAVAIAVGMALSVRLAQHDGYRPLHTCLALPLMAVVFVGGTKLHFWLANWDLVARTGVGELLWYGFHFPGGLVASIVVAPLLLRALGLRVRSFADSIAPAVALAVAVARIGCFANGCCFGYVSAKPWAIAFPVGSRAYAHHSAAGLLPPGAAVSQPVLPLMLFFAVASFAIAVIVWVWRPRRKFVGQLGLGFVALWSVANVFIESWRDSRMVPGTPYLREVSLVIAAVAVPALALLSYRHRGRRRLLR